MSKTAKNLFYALSIGISVIITLWIYFSGRSTVATPVGTGLVMMYILAGLALIAAIVLSVSGLINNPRSAMMAGIGLGTLLVFIVIGYAIDDHQVKPAYVKYGVEDAWHSGIIGGSLTATWIVLGAAVLLTLYASLSDFFKKL